MQIGGRVFSWRITVVYQKHNLPKQLLFIIFVVYYGIFAL